MFSRSMFWKLILPIGMVLMLSALAMALYLPFVIRSNAEQLAVTAGRETVSQYIKLRQYYTDNVVAKVNGRAGLRAAAEHAGHPDVIPLPATMIHELSGLFGASGTTLKLYSPYPFPHRQGRVLDQFGQDAWAYLSSRPDQVFYRTETLGDKTMVRVAIADRMSSPSCVACHNHVAGSPKTDWKLGDVRGILEVNSSKQLDSGQRILAQVLAAFGLVLVLIALFLRLSYQRSIAGPLRSAIAVAQALTRGSGAKVAAVEAMADGKLDAELAPTPLPAVDPASMADDEVGTLLRSVVMMGSTQQTFDQAFLKMRAALQLNRADELRRDWLKSGQNELNALMRGEHEVADLAALMLRYLIERVGAATGALYLYDATTAELQLAASYAVAAQHRPPARIALGEGLVGQAARDRSSLQLSDLPAGYLPISSALGQAAPQHATVMALCHADALIGALEMGSLRAHTDAELAFLEQAREGVAIAFGVALSRRRNQELLEQSTQQTEELRVQQEELQQSNEELEERTQLLEQQRELIRAKNSEVEASSQQLRRKAEELERTSAYKSEFLANMSHELRTPLNSMLILSSLLEQNKGGQLSAKQVEYAATIHGAGKALLNLINDILDLSKIEAGRLELQLEDVPLAGLVAELNALFRPVAEHQALGFELVLDAAAPAALRTDAQRCMQILKNLLANAFKFTAAGQVGLRIAAVPAQANPLRVAALSFAVSDSGIGIAAEQQEQVFRAFQQADGSTSRKYGGTGLGLSISRQLARRMGGEISLSSEPGRGSVFTLYLPLRPDSPTAAAPEPAASQPAPVAPVEVADDRLAPPSGARTVLIIEDDPAFASILRDRVREQGFQALVAGDGESGLALAERHVPDAIILDVMLPHIDGWGVMRSLKDKPRTRHIPVHFITCLDDRQRALNMGAIGFITKPVTAAQLDEALGVIGQAMAKAVKKLLLVEDNETEASSIMALLEMGGLEIRLARSGYEALECMKAEKFDCLVLDLGLADMSGFELLDYLKQELDGRQLPVIVHSGRSLTQAEERRLQAYADSIIVKGAQSPERLLNEVSLFLHLVEGSLPQEKQRMIRHALDKEALFERRKVLLVDDDMRNVFSLSSVLAEKGMQIVEATTGQEALEQLEAQPDIDIVLMDVMMPEMDGYEAMRRIRQNPRLARLPIIALTAKAMMGDQKLCLDAGANDYIAKPVDLDKLFSLMRVWLYQGGPH